jgi:hypothetical protein
MASTAAINFQRGSGHLLATFRQLQYFYSGNVLRNAQRYAIDARRRDSRISARLARAVGKGRTQSRSISTATDLISNVTETTIRYCLRISIRKPSRPVSGPYSSKTRCPTLRYGHPPACKPDRTIRLMAAISIESIGVGTLPTPTKWSTPGVTRSARRNRGSSRQNRYPGNNGNSTVWYRSQRRRRQRYRGKKASKPLLQAMLATSFSYRDFTRNANHSPASGELVEMKSMSWYPGSQRHTQLLGGVWLCISPTVLK